VISGTVVADNLGLQPAETIAVEVGLDHGSASTERDAIFSQPAEQTPVEPFEVILLDLCLESGH